MTGAITVIVVDDHEIVREGLLSLFRGAEGIDVVGQASSGQDAVVIAAVAKPQVALVDVRMPGMDGLQTAQQLREVSPDTAVALLTMFDDVEFLARAIDVGASGYLLKGIGRAELLNAVHQLAAGGSVFDPALLPRLIPSLRESRAPTLRHSSELTPRERDVLREVVAGRTNAQIAHALGVSIETVKTHVHRIIQKLDAADRTQAAVFAVAGGLVEVPERLDR